MRQRNAASSDHGGIRCIQRQWDFEELVRKYSPGARLEGQKRSFHVTLFKSRGRLLASGGDNNSRRTLRADDARAAPTAGNMKPCSTDSAAKFNRHADVRPSVSTVPSAAVVTLLVG